MRNTAKIGAWVWVAIAGLAAVGALMDGHWVAALFLAGSALISMPLEAMQGEPGRQGVTTRHRVIFAVVLAMIGAAVLGVAGVGLAGSAASRSKLVPEVATPPSAWPNGDIRSSWAKFADAVAPCDQASKDMATVSGTDDVQRMYEQSHSAERLCIESSKSVRLLKGSTSALGPRQDRFNVLIDRCANAYLRKGLGYGKLAAVLDEDRRPLARWRVRDEMVGATDDQASCVVRLMDAVSKAGVELQ